MTKKAKSSTYHALVVSGSAQINTASHNQLEMSQKYHFAEIQLEVH